ncbi:uncharacterized protein LOC123510733 isoform X2 [Portunus trituberculatus]|uniref:uncharacterized protein LOC123510733 isoform X2 n=1 Tax=Portunus trituberculatus TaxID=210409 RepID=UPI001E1CE6CF|nr:uncharacterized protein LOC123510733 isoform X2 [Portunus trituberculatus]
MSSFGLVYKRWQWEVQGSVVVIVIGRVRLFVYLPGVADPLLPRSSLFIGSLCLSPAPAPAPAPAAAAEMELRLPRSMLMAVVAVVVVVVMVVAAAGEESANHEVKSLTSPSPPELWDIKHQCSLGSEVSMGGEGERVVMTVVVVGGLGAGAARRSCHAHGATPFFLNTQEDADILRRTLKDCVKSDKLGSVWVPVRRHTSHKGVTRPAAGSGAPAQGNLEYDWMSAQYNRASDTISLFPFPPRNIRRRGIICERKGNA